MAHVRELATFRLHPSLYSGVQETSRMHIRAISSTFYTAPSAQPT
jgi:hypothetical protein